MSLLDDANEVVDQSIDLTERHISEVLDRGGDYETAVCELMGSMMAHAACLGVNSGPALHAVSLARLVAWRDRIRDLEIRLSMHEELLRHIDEQDGQ